MASSTTRLLVLLCVVVGCGGGGDDDDGGLFFGPPLSDPMVLPIAQCAAVHANVLTRIVEGLQDLQDLINGVATPPNITENTPNVDYSILLDLDGDGNPDLSASVILNVTSGSLADGWNVGDIVATNININGSIVLAAQPIINVDAQSGLTLVQGPFAMSDSAGCSLNASNLVILWPTASPQTVSGVFTVLVTTATDTLSGQFQVSGDDDAILVIGDLNGSPVGFLIDLVTFLVFAEG